MRIGSHGRPAFQAGCAGMLLVLAQAVWGQEAPAPNAPLKFILHPVSDAFSGVSEIDFSDTEVVFKKEPAYASADVFRKGVYFGHGTSGYLAVAYDRAAQKLYVDSNQNLDLTDDGPGVVSSSMEDNAVGFSNLKFEIKRGDLSIPYVMQIAIFSGGRHFFGTICSGWQEEIEIAGKRCRIGVSDNLDGVFDHRDTFQLDHEALRAMRLPCGEVDNVPLPQWLYFNGQTYRMAFALQRQKNEVVAELTLQPVFDHLMEISVEGQYISRIMFQKYESREGLLVDMPAPRIRIPEGDYNVRRVDVLDSFSADPPNLRCLFADGNKTIRTGGPLKQSITVSRQGPCLGIQYQLANAADTPYGRSQYRPDKGDGDKIAFAVYQGERKVGGGHFEYG